MTKAPYDLYLDSLEKTVEAQTARTPRKIRRKRPITPDSSQRAEINLSTCSRCTRRGSVLCDPDVCERRTTNDLENTKTSKDIK